MTGPARRRGSRRGRRVAGIVAGVVLVAAAGTIVYSHTLTAPGRLTLPRVAPVAAGVTSVDGVWRVGPGSTIGWRVHQVLLGQQSTLASRTSKVWGSITIATGAVTQGSFSVDAAALTGNAAQRSVFGAESHPIATLVLAKPIPLGALPAAGAAVPYATSGTLTFDGVTRVVPFTAAAERNGNTIAVLADLPIAFPEWNIAVQGIPFVADLESPATVEVLLDLTRSPGNPASALARPGHPSDRAPAV